MTKAKNKWMTQVEEFFAANPGREFLLREMPLDAGRRTLNAVASAGWIVGAASCTSEPWGRADLSVTPGQKTVACIIRRANPAEGRPLPGVYFMDVGTPMPPLPPGIIEEDLARRMWALAQGAAHMGVPLVALAALAAQAMAEGAPAAGGYRH